MEMTAPSSGPPEQPYNAGVFALRMLIILVGGWVLVTIATGVMMEAAGGDIGPGELWFSGSLGGVP